MRNGRFRVFNSDFRRSLALVPIHARVSETIFDRETRATSTFTDISGRIGYSDMMATLAV